MSDNAAIRKQEIISACQSIITVMEQGPAILDEAQYLNLFGTILVSKTTEALRKFDELASGRTLPPQAMLPPQVVPQEPHEIIKGACGSILTAMEQGSFTVPQSLFLYKFGKLLVETTATALQAAGVNVSEYDVTKHTEPSPEQKPSSEPAVAPESLPEQPEQAEPQP